MAKLISLGEAVTRGEKKMLDYLQRSLPGDWLVLGNPQITTGELTRELDAIVIGDRCVWVVDEKGFGGLITGDEHTWVLSDGSARERVLGNILHAASMVKGRIVVSDPRLSYIWVEGLILLSAAEAELRVLDQRITKHVRALAGCEDYFIRAKISKAQPIGSGDRKAIERILAGEGVADRLRKRFPKIGAYRLLETLSSGPNFRSYRAERERTRDVVELKVYDLSALPEKQSREEARKRAEREFEALLKLRDTRGILRIAESFQAVEGYGGELYYFALDLPAGPCLASRLQDQSWGLQSRLAAAIRLCEVVRSVHELKVIHRNLSPACIHFWRTETDFHLTGFEFSRIPASSLQVSPEEIPEEPYTAPEVRDSLHNASRASDVYSLGVILFELLSGRRPFGNRTRTPKDPEPRLELPSESFSAEKQGEAEALLQLMVACAPTDRLEELGDAIEVLASLSEKARGPEEAHLRPSHPLPEGAQLGEFTVLGYLGAGGCFHAYRVAKHADDTQEYVAKVVRYPELIATAKREFAALSALDHPNIVGAYEVRARADAPYHLLEVYVPGRTARDLIAEGRTTAEKVAKWAAGLVDALVYMETRNPPIYHGDISPRNIILNVDRPCLVDFGLAYLGDVGHKGRVVGTAPYRPPERDVPDVPWPPSGDLYSLGLVLCELLFGELPYKSDMGQWDKRSVREELFEPRGQASREFLQVLRQAIAPSPPARFASAKEFQRLLANTPELAATRALICQDRGISRYLDDVLQVYNRGACNAENRGMDSAFARATYVPTELDTQLLPAILAKRYALVVLAGNPGDGKTAFLQQLALSLGFRGEVLPLNRWEIERDGWTYECVLDGSAADSPRGLSSDEVLDDILAPLERAGERPYLAESIRRTQLLAINDGRLLEYLDGRSKDSSWIVDHLQRLLNEKAGVPHPQLTLVDLNHRSLAVGGDDDAFAALLRSLLKKGGDGDSGEPWQVCRSCRAAASCHVRFNVDTFLHPHLGPQVRERMRMLLMLIHSRGRLHITIRELRSVLAFVIFGDQSCEQIHVELERGTQRQEGDGDTVTFRRNQRERLYFNRLFATGAKGGRLFEELSELDPACIDNPRFDRIVAAMQRSRSGSESLFVAADGRLNHVALNLESGSHAGDVGEQISHAELRRRAFFEGREEDGDSTAREGTWLEMTPFRSIRKWVENLQTFRQGQTELPSQLCRLICRAISLTDNVPEHLLDRYLAVRTASSQKTELVVVRLFESSAFRLVWEKVDTRATVMGELPTAMLLQYGERGDPTLEISADLFELLMRFAEGYRLGSEELEGVAAHLQLFKNRLLAMPAREVCLLHPALGRFVAKQELVAATRRISLEVAQ